MSNDNKPPLNPKGDNVFYAHSFNLGLCGDPKCTALHFELKDERGVCRAVMTMGFDAIPRITNRMITLVAEKAGGR